MSPLRGERRRGAGRAPRPAGARCAPVDRAPERGRRRPSRDWWPLAMIWDDDGTAVTPAAAVVTPAIGRARWRRSPAVVRRAPGCRSPSPPAAAACAAPACRCTAAWCSTSPRSTASSTSTTRRWCSTCAPARSARPRGRRCAPSTASPSATGRSRSTCRPSAGGSRAGARASSPPATARSRTWCSASTSSSPTAAPSTPAARRARRSDPTSPRCSWAARARSGSSPAPGCACTPRPPPRCAPRTASPTFADGLDACRRILRRGATPGGAAPLRRHRGRPPLRDRRCHHAARARRRRPGAARRRAARGARGVRERDRSTTSACSTPGSSIATTSPRCSATSSRGRVVDTMEVAARWSALPGVYDAVLAALRGCDDLAVASAHLSHAYSDGACLYFTFGGFPPKDQREDCYRRLWDAAMTATLAQRRGAEPPPRDRAQPRPLRRAPRSAPPTTCCSRRRPRSIPTGSSTPASSACPSPWGDPAWP